MAFLSTASTLNRGERFKFQLTDDDLAKISYYFYQALLSVDPFPIFTSYNKSDLSPVRFPAVRTDGEPIERAWAELNDVVYSGKEMLAGSRSDLLEDDEVPDLVDDFFEEDCCGCCGCCDEYASQGPVKAKL
ncbi:hypothetical protein R3P38DRAFT_3244105 [Favolaschia claudopus]|uniref:Uncharacterized protein n=1 Tax=Favolaschia claudopus TaxID=2862362 RepID=A0AAV9Z217_9AGAR